MVKTSFFQKPYIIAEIGQAHDGSLGTAHAYIDIAASSGASAVKFQTHYADEESSPEEPWRIKFSTQDKTRYDYWKRMEFSSKQWKELYNHSHDLGLDFISSPFSLKAVDVLINSGIDAWKIASGEISNVLMLDKIAKTKLPIVLSTGMSSISEIKNALDILQSKKSEVVVMQCTTSYPVEAERVGLNLIREFRELFNLSTGLSDHSGNIYSSLAAFTVGAVVVEVHLTISKKAFGPDVPASITSEDLSRLVEGAKWINTILDNPVDKDNIVDDFLELRKMFMKSFVAKKDIFKGEYISIDDIAIKKPYTGISASEPSKVIGKIACKKIPAGTTIMEEHIKPDKIQDKLK